MESIGKMLLFLCTCGESEKIPKQYYSPKNIIPEKKNKKITFEEVVQTFEFYNWDD